MKQTATVRKMTPRIHHHYVARGAKPVHVNSDKGGVDQDPVTISVGNHEEVTWFAHGNQRATIKFDTTAGSPFHDDVFVVPAGGSVSSGEAKSGIAYKHYKYTVHGPAGQNDPEVIIQR